jgi:hypothetical protein
MGFFRFHRRIKLAPCLWLNAGKTGVSASMGVPGATVNFKPGRALRTTVGIPGTGVSYVSSWGKSGGSHGGAAHSQPSSGSAGTWAIFMFILGVLALPAHGLGLFFIGLGFVLMLVNRADNKAATARGYAQHPRMAHLRQEMGRLAELVDDESRPVSARLEYSRQAIATIEEALAYARQHAAAIGYQGHGIEDMEKGLAGMREGYRELCAQAEQQAQAQQHQAQAQQQQRQEHAAYQLDPSLRGFVPSDEELSKLFEPAPAKPVTFEPTRWADPPEQPIKPAGVHWLWSLMFWSLMLLLPVAGIIWAWNVARERDAAQRQQTEQSIPAQMPVAAPTAALQRAEAMRAIDDSRQQAPNGLAALSERSKGRAGRAPRSAFAEQKPNTGRIVY